MRTVVLLAGAAWPIKEASCSIDERVEAPSDGASYDVHMGSKEQEQGRMEQVGNQDRLAERVIVDPEDGTGLPWVVVVSEGLIAVTASICLAQFLRSHPMLTDDERPVLNI